MTDDHTPGARRTRAAAEFRTAMKWIVAGAVLLVVAALVFLGLTSELKVHMVIATILGVFFAFSLGAGLFALAFFSDKSGHDQSVTDATTRRPPPD